MVKIKAGEVFGLIKNILLLFILRPIQTRNFFHQSLWLCKKLKIVPAQRLLNPCLVKLRIRFFEIKVVQQ